MRRKEKGREEATEGEKGTEEARTKRKKQKMHARRFLILKPQKGRTKNISKLKKNQSKKKETN